MNDNQQKLSKINLIMITVCLAVIVLGFILMVGEPNGANQYNPDIYSFRRITVGPMVSFFGFLAMIVAILYKPRNKNNEDSANKD